MAPRRRCPAAAARAHHTLPTPTLPGAPRAAAPDAPPRPRTGEPAQPFCPQGSWRERGWWGRAPAPCWSPLARCATAPRRRGPAAGASWRVWLTGWGGAPRRGAARSRPTRGCRGWARPPRLCRGWPVGASPGAAPTRGMVPRLACGPGRPAPCGRGHATPGGLAVRGLAGHRAPAHPPGRGRCRRPPPGAGPTRRAAGARGAGARRWPAGGQRGPQGVGPGRPAPLWSGAAPGPASGERPHARAAGAPAARAPRQG